MRTLVAAAEPPERPPQVPLYGSWTCTPVPGLALLWPPPQTFSTTTTTVVRLHWQPTN